MAAEKARLAKLQEKRETSGSASRGGSLPATWTSGPCQPTTTPVPWLSGKGKTGAEVIDLEASKVAAACGPSRNATDVEKALELVQLCEKQGMGEDEAFLLQARQRLEEARSRRDASKPIALQIRDAEALLVKAKTRLEEAESEQARLQEQLHAAAEAEQKASEEASGLSREIGALRLEYSTDVASECAAPCEPYSLHAAVCALVPAERRGDPSLCVAVDQFVAILSAFQQPAPQQPPPANAEDMDTDLVNRRQACGRGRTTPAAGAASADPLRAQTRSPRRGGTSEADEDDLFSGNRSRQ